MLCFPPMELNNKKLQSLIERAWGLHDHLNHEIEHSISFCRYCSENGRFCDIGETPLQERMWLITIRDSLKQVENTLLHLQKLQSWQLTDRHLALNRFEESRLSLMKQLEEYEGRGLDAVKELSACFGNDDKKDDVQSLRTRSGVSGFMIFCIRVLFNPWKWQNAVGVAVKLILISASLSSTIRFCHAKQQSYTNSPRKFINSAVYSKENFDGLLTISKIPLDVFSGRG